MTCVNIQLSSQKYSQERLVSENYLENVTRYKKKLITINVTNKGTTHQYYSN